MEQVIECREDFYNHINKDKSTVHNYNNYIIAKNLNAYHFSTKLIQILQNE